MILMYHKIAPTTPTMWWVSINDFYRQMSELSNKNVVYLDDYDLDDVNQVVITFDGIYKNIIDYALPILKHFNYPFELFLTSDYIGKDNQFDSVEPLCEFVSTKELKELVRYKGRLQWHTKTHKNLKEVYDIEIITKELTIPKQILQLDNKGFNWFAYPHGEYNNEILKAVKRKFKGAVSCNQGNNDDKFTLNRLTVLNETSFRENKIACIIASYNYGDYLIEAVESVLKQTILPDEILITDDCSNDDTQEISKMYVKKHPNLIKYNRNAVNLGIVENFNKAVSLTNSEYIFFLGADNRILSNYIEHCANALDKSEDIGIAYTDYAFFGSRAKKIYDKFKENRKKRIIHNTYYQINFPVFNTLEEVTNELKINNFIHGSSMFKRTCFKAVGGYVNGQMAEDYNLFKRITNKGWMAVKAEETNLEYRQHSASQANNLMVLQNKLIFYKKQLDSLSIKKNNFEMSFLFRISYKTFSYYMYLKENYKKPKKIIKKVVKKFLK